PTETERCERAEGMVRNAVKASKTLSGRDVRVFSQGSFRNRTNVRGESDVDIGVVCYDTFFHALPPATVPESVGIVRATYQYRQFKNELEGALRDYFGWDAVSRGNKAFDVRETTYHVEADVTPFFEHRRYRADGTYMSGVEFLPDNNPGNSV